MKRTRHPANPLLFGIILVAFVALAGAASLLNPLFESTDELRHYRYVRHLVVRGALPVQGEETVRSQSHHPPLYYLLSAVASAWVPSDHTPEYEHPFNPFWGYRNWDVGVDNKLQYLHSDSERFPFREGFLGAMIPRWVNVALGAITVWLTYRLGRRIWPARPALAWGAAALVAFNPQFIYLSGAMNNDVIAAATGAATLLLCVELAKKGIQNRRLVKLGVVFGLALLSKLHLAALGAIIALALFTRIFSPAKSEFGRRKASWQLALRSMVVVLAVAALLSGWWFARNWLLYGDPTGLNKVNELWSGRPAGGNWWALEQGLPYLWSSLWARFGYGQIPLPQPYYTTLLLLSALALAGHLLPLYISRFTVHVSRFTPHLPVVRLSSFVLLPATILIFTAIVFYYILIQPAGPMGRFLFPALPALAVLLVEGLNRWIRRPRWTAAAVTVGMAVFAGVALGGYLWPAVRYPPSNAVTSAMPTRFGDVAQIHSVTIEPAAIHPGEPVFVTVVWEPLRRTNTPYAVYVHLADETGAIIAQRDTWPGLGRAPTTGWRPGVTFADTYRIDLPQATYAPNKATARVGLYEPSLGRLPSLDADGQPIGDGITAGQVAIKARPGPLPNPQSVDFGGEIALVGYTLDPRTLAAGGIVTLTTYWQPGPNVRRDYSIFAQVLDAEWNVWGSQDSAGPDWNSPKVVRDVRHITLRPETPPGSYPIQVGLYHGDAGRLPVLAPDGHYLDDRVLLGPIKVTREE